MQSIRIRLFNYLSPSPQYNARNLCNGVRYSDSRGYERIFSVDTLIGFLPNAVSKSQGFVFLINNDSFDIKHCYAIRFIIIHYFTKDHIEADEEIVGRKHESIQLNEHALG